MIITNQMEKINHVPNNQPDILPTQAWHNHGVPISNPMKYPCHAADSESGQAWRHMLHAAGIISYMHPNNGPVFCRKMFHTWSLWVIHELPGHQQNTRTPLSILVREVERGLYRSGRWIPCTYLVIVKRLKNGPPYDSKRTRSYNDNLYLRNNQPSTSYLWWLKLFHNAWLYHSI